MKKQDYNIVFNFSRETKKAILVRKKTKKIDEYFWIPKSIILKEDRYEQERNLYKDVKYKIKRIELWLPRWFVEKELGFYK